MTTFKSTFGKTNIKNTEFYHCVNLRNETKPQLFHFEFMANIKFILIGTVKSSNPNGIGRYNIDAIDFELIPYDNNKKLYIKSITFKGFVSEIDLGNKEGSAVKNIVDLEIETSKEEPNENNSVFSSPRIGVYKDAIINIHFTGFFNSPNHEQKNFGGHICRSRIAF
ncbi:MAG: hypothetical protein ACPGTO_00550 [Polaribacter sp.]